MITLYSTRLSQQSSFNAGFEDYMNFVPGQSRLKYRQHTHEAGRNSKLTGELLSRYALQTRFDILNTELCFEYSEKGKPFVKDHPEMHFNISHSGDFVVCAVADNLTGIDVERIRNTRFDIAKRYFSPEECHDLYSLPNYQQQDYFFVLWTLKESYLKSIGEGLALNLNAFTVVRTSTGFALTGNGNARNFHVRSYDLGEGYKMAVCTLEKAIPDIITPVLPQQFIQALKPFSS